MNGSTLKNDRLLRALKRQPVDTTPVWIMRQAGRYLPEYRATRKRAGSFLSLCKTPDLACEVTLQPLARFALDAAILFSDILTIPDAMGLGLRFPTGDGPRFERPVRRAADVQHLGVPDPEQDLGYVMDAIRVTRQALAGRVPLIGFAGSPWTLATYMVEGGSSKEFNQIKGMLYDAPELLAQLLDVLSESIVVYLKAQIEAGVQAVMLFDTWGGVLTPAQYLQFSLAPMRYIIERIRQADITTPIILFTKGGGAWLEAIAGVGCDAVGLDWTIDIGRARHRIGHHVALQGNLDPAALHAKPIHIRAAVAQVLDAYGPGPGHIFNLGHGIHQGVEPYKVEVLVDAVHELSRPYHLPPGTDVSE